MNLSSCNCDCREWLEVDFEDAELDFVEFNVVKLHSLRMAGVIFQQLVGHKCWKNLHLGKYHEFF